MDWGELGQKIAGTGAKLLGEAIPVPGAEAVADMAADALGADKEPEAMARAMNNDPESAAKLKKLEQDHKEQMKRLALQAAENRMAAETERVQAVNKTMRAGYDANVYWRRAWGWISAIAFGGFVAVYAAVAYMAVTQGQTELLGMLPQLASAATTLFAVPMAVLGVAEWQSGKERRALAGEKNGGVTGVIKAIRGESS